MSAILAALMLPFAVIGAFFTWNVLVREKNPPADATNRLAHMRLVWFAMRRPELFVGLFPWLGRDEFENSSG